MDYAEHACEEFVKMCITYFASSPNCEECNEQRTCLHLTLCTVKLFVSKQCWECWNVLTEFDWQNRLVNRMINALVSQIHQIFATPSFTPSSKVTDREWFHFALPDLSTKNQPRNFKEPEHIWIEDHIVKTVQKATDYPKPYGSSTLSCLGVGSLLNSQPQIGTLQLWSQYDHDMIMRWSENVLKTCNQQNPGYFCYGCPGTSLWPLPTAWLLPYGREQTSCHSSKVQLMQLSLLWFANWC